MGDRCKELTLEKDISVKEIKALVIRNIAADEKKNYEIFLQSDDLVKY